MSVPAHLQESWVCVCVCSNTLSHTHIMWWKCLNCDYFPSAVAQGGDLVSVCFPAWIMLGTVSSYGGLYPGCVFLYLCVCGCVCVCSYLCKIWRTEGINNAICDKILCKHNKTGSLNHVSCHRHGHLFPVLVAYCLEKRSIYSKLGLRLSNHKSQMLLSFLHWFQVLFHSFSHIFLVSV